MEIGQRHTIPLILTLLYMRRDRSLLIMLVGMRSLLYNLQ